MPAANPSPATAGGADRRRQWEAEFREVQRIFVFYGAMLLPILGLACWTFHTKRNEVEFDLAGSAVFYATITAFAIAWRREWFQLVRWPVEWSGRLLALTLATPLCTIPAAHLLSIGGEAIGLPVESLIAGFRAGGYSVGSIYVWIAVLPAIFEEIAFRGVVLAKLQHVMRPTQAIWVCALLFGILHFSVLSMAVFLVPLAAVAGYLTRRTGSLVAAIAIHAIHNAGMISIELLRE